MDTHFEDILKKAFSLLSIHAGRKKVYATKALKEGQKDIAHLMRAMSHSEYVQARRLFHTLRGRIDTSEQYVSTIFEKEIEQVISEYAKFIDEAKASDNTAMIQAFSQLSAAERRLKGFYSLDKKQIKAVEKEKYFVCQFCGYLHEKISPEKCPVCGADKNGFKEVV